MALKQGTVTKNVKTEEDDNKPKDQAIALQNGRVMMSNQRRPMYQGPQITPGNRRAGTTRRGDY